MEKATLYSPNISCGHCIMSIKRAVSALQGVTSVDGDPAAKKVTVEYDTSKVTLDRIEATMAEEGYPVQK
ncbi:MAG: cation transporter [Chloroflexi bacterium]|nr:cation transporter [Chloroflexota bacterium]